MHSHNFSFILDGNAVSPPNIGTQFRKGNYWEPGAHTARAALSSAPSLVSRFFMHSLNIEFFPTSVDPPDWFTGDIGSLAATCMPGAAAEDGTTDLDDQIADGTYFSTTTPPLVAWELKRNLYYKLLRDPGYGQGNPNYAAFQQANANTTVGKFAKVAHDMYTASAVPAAISQQVDDLDARSAAFLLQLEQLEAGQPPAVEPYDQDNTFLAAKRALLDSINLVGSQRAALTNQLAADFAVKLALVRADNQAIVTAHGFEANQKALNEIAIKMALREAYTVADLATVQGIAAQSESAAGTTQWQANAMLPPCQRAPWPESGRDKTEDRDAAPARPDVARNKLFEVSPNPASDLATVRFGQPFSGTLVLMDARANTVQQFELSASTQWNVETKSLPHGIYYLQAYDQQGRPTTLKIVVTH